MSCVRNAIACACVGGGVCAIVRTRDVPWYVSPPPSGGKKILGVYPARSHAFCRGYSTFLAN